MHHHSIRRAAVAHTVRCAREILAGGGQVTVDATSTTTRKRATWLGLAREHGVAARAVAVDTPLPVCLARNAARPPRRRVPAEVVRRMWGAVHDLTDTALTAEGFVHINRPADAERGYAADCVRHRR